METLVASGLNGQVSFDGTTVLITREGFVGRATHGRSEKSLPIKSIGAVQFRAASALVNGFVQFSVTGETSKRSVGFGKNADASKDENAVVFRKRASDDFQKVVAAIRASQAA